MRVLELLAEIEDIVDTASGFPLTGKIMVDSNELLEIVNDIKAALPDEIQQAQWIKNERDRILDEARNEYETIVRDAQNQAEALVAKDEIMSKARSRSEDLMAATEENSRQLKMSTYDYVDGILFDFQEKLDKMRQVYFKDLFEDLEKSFNGVNETLASNREEIKEMAYKTTMNMDGVSLVERPKDPSPGIEQSYSDDYDE
jgi:vacuolar-type H+-ATPase subunit H